MTYRCILLVVLGDSPCFIIDWEDLGHLLLLVDTYTLKLRFYAVDLFYYRLVCDIVNKYTFYEDDYFDEDD